MQPCEGQAANSDDFCKPLHCQSEGLCRCGINPVSATEHLYKELPSEDHIRLLELLPGPGRVECRMHFALLPNDKDTYEALSNTWDLNYYEYGENRETFSIWYNGLEINVTENLYTALCNRRDQSSPALLWVDALCSSVD